MKPTWLDSIREMRLAGYSVVIFSPNEVGNAPSDELEDILIQRGWDFIELQNPPDHMSTVFEV